MNQPFFSIVIPTRNRAAELFHTLRTCVGQDFDTYGNDSFEVVVSDNHSDDDIAAVVRAIDSPKVTYVRTHQYLSMTDSWEFAVSQAKGLYVGIVGTDDGYLLNTLSRVHNAIEQSKADAVTFQGAYYYWPTCSDVQLRNKLLVPNFIFEAGLQDSRQLITESLQTLYYGRLPCFLNSFCSNQLIRRIRMKHGRIFDAVCPDVYSGFLLAGYLKQFYVCNRSMLVGGVSGASTGSNAYFDPQGTTLSEHLQLSGSRASPLDLINYPFVTTLVLESAALALNRSGHQALFNAINVEQYLAHCHQQTLSMHSELQRAAALTAIQKYLTDHPTLRISMSKLQRSAWRRRIQSVLPHRVVQALQTAAHHIRGSTGVLANKTLDAKSLNIHNVYDAARFLTHGYPP